MSSAERITERLPSLYRPDDGGDPDRRDRDADLLVGWLGAVGHVLDDIGDASSAVMQAHWLPYADAALLSDYVRLLRKVENEPPLRVGDAAIDRHPYLCDLPRIGALFDTAPLREPPLARDGVEAFRLRLRNLLALYRDGVGTLTALRRAVQLALPYGRDGLRQRPFTVEEHAPQHPVALAVRARGAPTELLGPLMRFVVDSHSVQPVLPAVFIGGVAPVPGRIAATAQPIVERLDAATNTGVGIAYEDTLAPNQVLALWPAYNSWLAQGDGIDVAVARASATANAHPAAPGPWARQADAPVGAVVAFARSLDHGLYAALNNAGVGELWRFDGSQWTQRLAALPELHCLLADGQRLWLGHVQGASVLPLFDALAPAVLHAGPAVRAMAMAADGTRWAATADGAANLRDDTGLALRDLGARPATRTSLHAVQVDEQGLVLFGGELGVFEHAPAANRWSVLLAGKADDLADDWRTLDLATGVLPAADEIFVPPVRGLLRTADGSLWLATDAGIARYLARARRRTYTTLLEAYPGVTTARVDGVQRDERGGLWFASATGLLHFDGLVFWQRQDAALLRLPVADEAELPTSEGAPLVQWRFVRATARWEQLVDGRFTPFTAASIAAAQPAVRAVAFTDSVHPELGAWNGEDFVADLAAVPAGLRMRVKPIASRIVDGGIPAVPRLQVGSSEWRYLSLEGAAPPVPRSLPAYTIEGRLLPDPSQGPAAVEARLLATVGREAQPQAFAFDPAARLWLRWAPYEALTVLVRLRREQPDETLDPGLLTRLFEEVQRVRPAGVRLGLAVDEELVR